MPLRVFPSGLTDEGRPVLTVGSTIGGAGSRPEHRGGNEQGTSNHFSLFPECGHNVTAASCSGHHDSPTVLECTLNL